jgi:hypothetical protein
MSYITDPHYHTNHNRLNSLDSQCHITSDKKHYVNFMDYVNFFKNLVCNTYLGGGGMDRFFKLTRTDNNTFPVTHKAFQSGYIESGMVL